MVKEFNIRKLLCIFLLLTYYFCFALLFCHFFTFVTEPDFKCTYYEGGYYVKRKDDVWRMIMLPGTKLSFAARQVKTEKDENGETKLAFVGEAVISKGEKGKPSDIEDFEENHLRNINVSKWYQVENGNYCVLGNSSEYPPRWTVWTDRLFEKWTKLTKQDFKEPK